MASMLVYNFLNEAYLLIYTAILLVLFSLYTIFCIINPRMWFPFGAAIGRLSGSRYMARLRATDLGTGHKNNIR